MPAATFSCPKCHAALGIEPGMTEATARARIALRWSRPTFFPVFFPVQAGAAASALVDHTEASCFNHPQKQAVDVCDGCGRMICALCSIELNDEHLCPNCISSGKKKGRITTLEDTRTRYDSIAVLARGLRPVVLSSPFFSLRPRSLSPIRHWNSPGSLLGVSKTRFVIAIMVATR